MNKHAVSLAAALGLAAALSPEAASAFCGFYVSPGDQKLTNNATMVVLMREGQRTVLSMQNNYKGPTSDFAMVVPVPIVLQKENVKTLPREVFDKVDLMASPRLVEYWEQDPCPRPGDNMEKAKRGIMPSPPAAAAPGRAASESLGVTVEAEFTVGEYEVVVLSARDSDGLDTWLRQNNYKIPEGAEPVLRPYVAKAMKFFVAKVNASKVKFEAGQAVLSPLRFHYDSDDFSLPVRLGLLNSDGKQELVVHILARGKRYQVANYPNVTIPTNYDVADEVKGSFGSFYAALFDRTVEKHPGAIITEYAWDASTCDPCPGPNLGPSDIFTLGADALSPTEPPPNLATPATQRAVVTIDDITNPDKILNAESTLRRATPRFEACYALELARTSSPKGRILFNGTVQNGRMRDLTQRTTGNLPPAMITCLEGVMRNIYYAQPRGAGQGQAAGSKLSASIDFNLEPTPPGQQGWWKPQPVNTWGFTLTRLHARYSREALGQDLIFREAPPIVGGREDHAAGEQDHEARPGTVNNFQARYAIRHPWTGPIACSNPKRGVWGGPPAGTPGGAKPTAASKIAFVPRGEVKLASLLRQSIPDLGLTAPPGSALPGSSGAGASGARGSCACAVGEQGGPLLPATLAAFAALILRERRRRRG